MGMSLIGFTDSRIFPAVPTISVIVTCTELISDSFFVPLICPTSL